LIKDGEGYERMRGRDICEVVESSRGRYMRSIADILKLSELVRSPFDNRAEVI